MLFEHYLHLHQTNLLQKIIQMFSAIRKKLGGDKEENKSTVMPSGVQRVDAELQRKFARGVQYNC